jgi:hypothetical protein
MRGFTPLLQCACGADAVLVVGGQLYCAQCALARPSLGAEPWMPRPLRAPEVATRTAPSGRSRPLPPGAVGLMGAEDGEIDQ